MNKQITMMIGLPRSGKSTHAEALSVEHGWPIVSPDAIRLALHGQAFYGPAEDFVWAQARLMVRALFWAGHEHVIIDATNTTRERRYFWKKMGNEFAVIVHAVHFNTPVHVCKERAKESGFPAEVVERMFERFTPIDVEDEGFASLVFMST